MLGICSVFCGFLIISTQSQGPAIFRHIIETVFGEPMDGEIVKALQHFGISNHLSLMTMSDASIERIEFPDDSDNKNKIQLHDGHKQLIQFFKNMLPIMMLSLLISLISHQIHLTTSISRYITQIPLSIATPHHLHHPYHHIQKVLLMTFVNLLKGIRHSTPCSNQTSSGMHGNDLQW